MNSGSKKWLSLMRSCKPAYKTKPPPMLLLNPDRGDRYMETVYNPQWLMEQGIDLLNGDALTQSIHELQSVPLPITA
jgi:cysteine synthase A